MLRLNTQRNSQSIWFSNKFLYLLLNNLWVLILYILVSFALFLPTLLVAEVAERLETVQAGIMVTIYFLIVSFFYFCIGYYYIRTSKKYYFNLLSVSLLAMTIISCILFGETVFGYFSKTLILLSSLFIPLADFIQYRFKVPNDLLTTILYSYPILLIGIGISVKGSRSSKFYDI